MKNNMFPVRLLLLMLKRLVYNLLDSFNYLSSITFLEDRGSGLPHDSVEHLSSNTRKFS